MLYSFKRPKTKQSDMKSAIYMHVVERDFMVRCPSCKRECEKCKKAWTYGPFKVQAYACECGTDFRDYTLRGKHGFFLVKKRDKWKWTKA